MLAEEIQTGCNKLLAGRVAAMLEIVRNRRQEIGIPSYLNQFVIRHLDEFIKNAKQGMFINHKNQYVVDLDRTGRSSDLHPVITIQDKGTGSDLSTSQWSEGLHQFVQLKHGCRLAPFSQKAVFISNVSYLKGYKRLNGFSGTLGSVEENNSLVELYNADMVKIPTRKPKMFNEKVPILSKTKEEWVKNIFTEICNQVRAHRSVLVICQSIGEVEELHKAFMALYRQVDSRSSELVEAFTTIRVYTREFDEVLDFGSGKKFLPRQIILSTNLSGRGTDIVLSEELIVNGGLHVIVSYLPENSRIENQAYGRAARDGQKGSGQIICMIEDEQNGAANIFQLKQFRDNAEVHRLRSLKQYYDYHIAVEETCLKLFEDHCGEVMKAAHAATGELTIIQAIYFALLDEWAGWLDSKADDIRQCQETKNDVLKARIIASVKKFLEQHPLPQLNDYTKSLAWIRCPQPLLSIVLIYLEEEKTELASGMLDRIIQDFRGFEAEAYYYKGIIEQRKIMQPLVIQTAAEKDEDDENETGRIKAALKSVKKKWTKLDSARIRGTNWMIKNVAFSDDCPDSVIQKCVDSMQTATEYFLLSRSLFATRIRKRQDMANIVKTLQQNSSLATSRGFQVQQEEAVAVLECVIGSIDDILGHRASPEDVLLEGEAPHLAVHRFREIVRKADIITPPQLANKISGLQLQTLSTNHCLPLHVLKEGFQKIRKNEEIEEYDGQKIIRTGDLVEAFSLPSVRGFWESLKRAGCIRYEQVFIAIKKGSREKIPVLLPYEPVSFKLNGKNQIQLSSEDLNNYDLYEVHSKIKEDDAINAELQEAQEAGLVHIEIIGTIDPAALTNCEYLDEFSSLSAEAGSIELGIARTEAEWIMRVLSGYEIVKEREIQPSPGENNNVNKKTEDGQQGNFA